MAERFGEGRHVVQRQRHECAVRPESAIGDQEVQVRMPVGPRAVGLDRGDDADREMPFARGGADEGRDGARRDPREVAEQAPVIKQEKATQLVLGQAEVLSVGWAA